MGGVLLPSRRGRHDALHLERERPGDLQLPRLAGRRPPAGYAESFDARDLEDGHGTYTAPFTGIHGWYWENVGTEEITITLHTAGFYTNAHEGRARAAGYHDLTDLRGNSVPSVP